MILNLPLDAIIVDYPPAFKGYKIMRAPAKTEGIRRKRKVLRQVTAASQGLGEMEF
jgi:hypothetical protein